MANDSFKVKKSLNLEPIAGASPTAEGDIAYDSTAHKASLYNGTSASPVVTEAHSATLTNKTFDADGTGNSITNIENADIKAGAAIDRSKLATGTNYRVLANNSSGVMSENAAITAAHVVFADANGQLSGEATLAKSRGGTGQSNASLTFPSSGTVQATTPNNHGVLISGSGATATVLAPDSSTSKVLVSGGASADPAWGSVARSIVAAGTASHVVINDGSGNLSSEATLAKSRGGTGADNSSVTFPASGTVQAITPNQYGVLVSGSGATASVIAPDADTTKVLTSGGASANPTWQAVASVAPTASYDTWNLGLAASVSSNALTIALKQSDGSTDPSTGAAAVQIAFRNATAATGSYSKVSATAATSLVISSGSTLGTLSGGTHYIYVYAINNAGTIELGASLSIFDEGSVQSSTTEGGAGAADSNAVMYSTTGRSNKAIRLIGRLQVSEATAGTWATAPSEISLLPADVQNLCLKYQNTAGTSITSSAATVPFATKIYDTHNAFVGSTGIFTAPMAGKYRVTGNLYTGDVSNSTSQSFRIYALVTSTPESLSAAVHRLDVRWGDGVSHERVIHGSKTFMMSSGDTIALQALNSNTVSLDTTAGYNTICIEKVG